MRRLACHSAPMSRFHRNTFHPPKPDLGPVKSPAQRKPHGKQSGHAPPPWEPEPHGHEARESAVQRSARTRTRTRRS
jgi:hypothetical protein